MDISDHKSPILGLKKYVNSLMDNRDLFDPGSGMDKLGSGDTV